VRTANCRWSSPGIDIRSLPQAMVGTAKPRYIRQVCKVRGTDQPIALYIPTILEDPFIHKMKARRATAILFAVGAAASPVALSVRQENDDGALPVLCAALTTPDPDCSKISSTNAVTTAAAEETAVATAPDTTQGGSVSSLSLDCVRYWHLTTSSISGGTCKPHTHDGRRLQQLETDACCSKCDPARFSYYDSNPLDVWKDGVPCSLGDSICCC